MSYNPNPVGFTVQDLGTHLLVVITSQPSGGLMRITSVARREGQLDLLFDRGDNTLCTGQHIPLPGIDLGDRDLLIQYADHEGVDRRATFPAWVWGGGSADMADPFMLMDIASSGRAGRYTGMASPLEAFVHSMPEPVSRFLRGGIRDGELWVREGDELVLPSDNHGILSHEEVRIKDLGDRLMMTVSYPAFMNDRYGADRAVQSLLYERSWRSWGGFVVGPIDHLGYAGYEGWDAVRASVDKIQWWQAWLADDMDVIRELTVADVNWRIKRRDGLRPDTDEYGGHVWLVLQRDLGDGWRTVDRDGQEYTASSWADVEMDLGEHLTWDKVIDPKHDWYIPHPLAMIRVHQRAHTWGRGEDGGMVTIPGRLLAEREADAIALLHGLAVNGDWNSPIGDE